MPSLRRINDGIEDVTVGDDVEIIFDDNDCEDNKDDDDNDTKDDDDDDNKDDDCEDDLIS